MKEQRICGGCGEVIQFSDQWVYDKQIPYSKGEVVICTKDNKEYPTLLKINPSHQ